MVIHECSDYTGALQEEEEKEEAPLTRLNHTLTILCKPKSQLTASFLGF